MATPDNSNFHFPNILLGEADMMNSVGVRWKRYVSRFNNFLVAMNITEEGRKRALLLHIGDFYLQDIYEGIGNSDETYEQLVQALTNYFEPRTNDTFEVFNFQQTKHQDGESIQQYYLRLHEFASWCNFEDVNKNIKTQLILGTNSQKLRKYWFANNDASVQNILTRGKLFQNIDYQTKELQAESAIKVKDEPEDVQAIQVKLSELHE